MAQYAKMKRTIIDILGGGEAIEGRVYKVLDNDGFSVELYVPCRHPKLPKEFIVPLDSVVLFDRVRKIRQTE